MSTTQTSKTETNKPEVDQERQIVALQLAGEMYGVDIDCIRTVLTPQTITTVPNVPAYVKGVMNLRGKILPVLDLRARFGLPPLAPDKEQSARIMIVEANGLTAGLIVDGVSEVIRLPAGSVEPPSALLGSSDLRCLTGIGRVPSTDNNLKKAGKGERLLLLLDIPQTLALASKDSLTDFTA